MENTLGANVRRERAHEKNLAVACKERFMVAFSSEIERLMEKNKSLHEVAFEWLCCSGGFHSLEEQCKRYKTEKAVYRFVLPMDIILMLDFNAELGNMAISQPRNLTALLQEVAFITFAALSWMPFLVSPNQLLLVVRFYSLPSLPSCEMLKNRPLLGLGSSGLFHLTGVVCGLTPVMQYTQSARFCCPLATCPGSARHCYIRVHIPGKSEAVTVRSDFVCRYCGCTLQEDLTCRALADRCSVQVISAAALHQGLWFGEQKSSKRKRYQALTVFVRDELVKCIEVGELFSFVLVSSREIHARLGQYHCTPTFEANNLTKVYPQTRPSSIPKHVPSTIMLLYEDRKASPWSFVASLAFSFGASVAPPGTHPQLKLGLLLSLMLLHGRGADPDTQQTTPLTNQSAPDAGSLDRLHVLAVGGRDLPRAHGLLRFGASFADRMVVHSSASELFASTSRDPHGSGTCIVHAGCVLLASGGICLVPNLTTLKKDSRDKLQKTLETGAVAMEIPDKYRGHHEEQLSVPLKSTVWACADALHDNAAPHPSLESRALTRALMERFSLVFGPPTHHSQLDLSDELCANDVLSRALENEQEEKSVSYISDAEMTQFIKFAGRRRVRFTNAAHELVQRYYLASRRVQISGGQAKEFPLTSLKVLRERLEETPLQFRAAVAGYSSRITVLEEDAVAAIQLYDETLCRWLGFPGVCPTADSRHSFPGHPRTIFGPENVWMQQYHRALVQFCSAYANSKTFLGRFEDSTE